MEVASEPVDEQRSIPAIGSRCHTLGGHVSLGPKPAATFADLRGLGYRNMQLHATSPRTWRTAEKNPGDLVALRVLRLDYDIDPLFVHAVYLINLASEDERIHDASICSLTWSMSSAAHLGAAGVVVHVGSHMGRGFQAARPRIASALSQVLANIQPACQLILENSAGGGGTIGSDFTEMKAIIADLGDPPGLGLCVDTAHAFASGYDLRLQSEVDRLLYEVDAGPGLERLKALHLNDSKTEVGSHSDRHENIGAGLIGLDGFANLLSRPEIAGLPLVLETPNPEKRPADMAAIRAACAAPVAPALSEPDTGEIASND
jgi:deoxyribonuclease-4